MSSGSGAADRRAGLPSSGEVPAEHNAIAPGANASAVTLIDYVGNDFVFFTLFKTFLPTRLSSSTCIPFQITLGTASSSSEVPADLNARASVGPMRPKR